MNQKDRYTKLVVILDLLKENKTITATQWYLALIEIRTIYGQPVQQ